MSCAVNLLPESCHHARRRAFRRNVWTALLLSAGLLAVGSWAVLRATDQAILRLIREFDSVQMKQSELDRHLTLAARLRNELVEQARALSALRQEQPLPAQLLALTDRAPDGVVLTEIRSAPPVAAERPARRPSNTSRAAPTKPSRRAARHEQPALLVHMSGYALDHDELARLIDVLKAVPDWERVELLRATREPYGDGVGLAFRLECRQREASQ